MIERYNFMEEEGKNELTTEARRTQRKNISQCSLFSLWLKRCTYNKENDV
jgi:hypothetical protein